MNLLRFWNRRPRITYDTWQCCVAIPSRGNQIIAKKNGFCADPFFLGEDIVLFEFYSFEHSRGWIEAYDLREDRSYKVYDNYLHASFPFVFRDRDRVFVIPEQRAKNLLEAFPVELDSNGHVRFLEKRSIALCDTKAMVDAMFFVVDGKSYCIYNEDIGGIGDPGGTLLLSEVVMGEGGLKHAESVLLSSDFRTARNGGTVWYKRNSLFRVFQRKQAGKYGMGIAIERIQLDFESGIRIGDSKVITPAFFRANKLDSQSHHIDIKPWGRVWDVRRDE